MIVTVVGCSGSLPGPTSAASCYLLEVEDEAGRPWRVLLDLGSGALGPLQQYVEPYLVDAVLLSHLHPDHVLDLCGLYVAARYHPVHRPPVRIPVWGPAGTADRLADAYGAEPDPGVHGEFDVHEHTSGGPVRIGPLQVTPIAVRHPVPAFALRVEAVAGPSRGAVLTYSGDTDSCRGLVDAATGADVLLVEAAFVEGRDLERGVHLTGRRAGLAAREAGVRQVVLTHVPPWNDPAVALAEAREVHDGPITLAHPGLRIDVLPASSAPPLGSDA